MAEFNILYKPVLSQPLEKTIKQNNELYKINFEKKLYENELEFFFKYPFTFIQQFSKYNAKIIQRLKNNEIKVFFNFFF